MAKGATSAKGSITTPDRATAPNSDRLVGEGSETPRGTCERILDVALDLFIEKGFDKTSLREISEQLGFSKAALYYHFASKDDILMALHLRLHEMGQGALSKLGDRTPTPREWEALLDSFIAEMLANRKLFLLHERNRAALEHLHTEEHSAAHDDLEARLRGVLSDPSLPIDVRVRMSCSLGAVMGGLLMGGDFSSEISEPALAELLQQIVRGLLKG